MSSTANESEKVVAARLFVIAGVWIVYQSYLDALESR
jgi:hypothetical protein